MTGTLIATIGPAGAGKTEWLKANHPLVPSVSLDWNRRNLSPCGCSANQNATPYAVELGVRQALAGLARGSTVAWDATNWQTSERIALQMLAGEVDARTVGVVILPPLLDTLARNATRDLRPCWCGYARRVPEQVIWSMHLAITRDLPTMPAEGWDDLWIVALPPHVALPAWAGGTR